MVTPVRRQYLDMKARYPDAILLFRLGDFYETFDDDAKLVAAELDIALTSKPMGGGLRSPLAGVPVRSVEQHLAKLVEKGHRVAICEQLERAQASRGLVRRGVVRVVSPGTALEPALLEAGEASACAAVALRRERRVLRLGVAAADVTTGACHVAEIVGSSEEEGALWQRAAELFDRLGVRELLVSEDADVPPVELAVTRRPAFDFRVDAGQRALQAQFEMPPAAVGLDGDDTVLCAIGALLQYLQAALPDHESPLTGNGSALSHLSPPQRIEIEQQLQWDRATGLALAVTEAVASERRSSGPRTLLDVVERCGSAPGRRWLRSALAAPLLDLERIERRLDRVEALVSKPSLRRALIAKLRGAPDLERLFGRAASELAQPGELASLTQGLVEAAAVGALIRDAGLEAETSALGQLGEQLGPTPESVRALAAALAERPPAEFGHGVVRAGVDAEIDRLRATVEHARSEIVGLESTLREESGIDGVRIGFHRTFGYQIELTRHQATRAPETWERRQSLRDRERYTEPRLRAIEDGLEAAEEALAEAERACVEQLRRAMVDDAASVRRIASALARLDAAASLASVAAERAWTRPAIDHTGELEIEDGRHPIVEAAAAQGGFVPNDLRLADDGGRAPQLLLVTGPNMAGKSTYLRQSALIVILAQAGSFVPAGRARVGLVDRIFARVGAHDDLAGGRSTFMVEMLETARLLHGASERSLVLLDEIGRGTSTWDGLAIAQAVAEFLAGGCVSGRSERGPRTLFATHFHELTALAGRLPRVANAAVQVEETEAGAIEFLYRIASGAADRSYGVQVAAQAGLPRAVVARARTLLSELEGAPAFSPDPAPIAPTPVPQLHLMPPPTHPIVQDLADFDIDGMTPLEAISALYALRDQARVELRGELRGMPHSALAEARS